MYVPCKNKEIIRLLLTPALRRAMNDDSAFAIDFLHETVARIPLLLSS